MLIPGQAKISFKKWKSTLGSWKIFMGPNHFRARAFHPISTQQGP
jgi:hypothetical protein